MRVAITLFVESQEEAKETLAALAAINALPWRQSTFGVGPKVPVWSSQTSDVESFEEQPQEIQSPPEIAQETEPPGKATSSIKHATEAKIMDLLSKPLPIDRIKPILKAPKEHCENLLRLLWERGKISFDGTNYRKVER